jgi:hypothetical protein
MRNIPARLARLETQAHARQPVPHLIVTTPHHPDVDPCALRTTAVAPCTCGQGDCPGYRWMVVPKRLTHEAWVYLYGSSGARDA